jgi:2-hydroxychromene-2-carboxylate isomerase
LVAFNDAARGLKRPDWLADITLSGVPAAMICEITEEIDLGADLTERRCDRAKSLQLKFQSVVRTTKARTTKMGHLRKKDVEAIVAAQLAEHQSLQCEDVGVVASKTLMTMLNSLGIEQDDHRDLRADLDYLRRWRKNIEEAQSYAFKASITVIVTGFIGAIWLGINAAFGK